MIEINAPPSLDTATGNEDAEGLHEGNVGGILRQFVFGISGTDRWIRLTSEGGCVESVVKASENSGNAAALAAPVEGGENRELYNANRSETINRMKYCLYERKRKSREAHANFHITPEALQRRMRLNFPYFRRTATPQIFLESAGGAQVPAFVSDRVVASIENRWRDNVGAKAKKVSAA